MATHSYTAIRSAGSWSVTRSTDDGLAATGGAKAQFQFDDATVPGKTVLAELWQDTLNRLGETLRGVSSLADLGGGTEHAFADDADFVDGALFADQGAGFYTLQATIDAHNNHAVAAGTANQIGSADAVLIFAPNITKLEARNAIEAIRRGLKRDSLAFSDPASYPTSGSFGV